MKVKEEDFITIPVCKNFKKKNLSNPKIDLINFF